MTWITDQLPDSETTVLMRLQDEEYPIWPGFHDEGEWCNADATLVTVPVLGWLPLETAAQKLDTPPA